MWLIRRFGSGFIAARRSKRPAVPATIKPLVPAARAQRSVWPTRVVFELEWVSAVPIAASPAHIRDPPAEWWEEEAGVAGFTP